MRVDPATGLLMGACYLCSPNADERPAGMVADMIVIHGISLPLGEFGGPWIDALFTNRLSPWVHPSFSDVCGLKVSAHVLIRRDGEVVQYVPFHRRAWHAGASNYRGRTDCNDFSIGIELEGTDDLGYEGQQYTQLVAIILGLIEAYPSLSCQHIAGHADIAPGRKTDPGPAFEWSRLRRLLGEGPHV
jgi:AmpD protein